MGTVDKCSVCGCDTKVIETRATMKGIRRRRECIRCGHKYSTWETLREKMSIHQTLEELKVEIDNIQSSINTITDLIKECEENK